MAKPIVSIVMGSDSDLPVMQEAAKIMEEFGIPYEVSIKSCHRIPDVMAEYAAKAHTRGIRVIIAGACGAAHLPGMISAITPLPVIGVPVQTRTMSGIDSLYSIVQMPPGVPTATVSIGGAKNAGLLAVQILGSADKKIQEKMIKYKHDLKKMVIDKATELEKIGYKKYLELHGKK